MSDAHPHGTPPLELVEPVTVFTPRHSAATPIIIWTAAPDGGLVGEAEGWAALTGLAAPPRDPAWLAQRAHPDDRAMIRAAWEQAMATARPFVITHRLRDADGVYHPFLTQALPTRDAAGQLLGWRGVSAAVAATPVNTPPVDATPYAQAFAASETAELIVGRDGTIRDCTAGAAALFAQERDVLRGARLSALTDQAGQPIWRDGDALARGEPWRGALHHDLAEWEAVSAPLPGDAALITLRATAPSHRRALARERSRRRAVAAALVTSAAATRHAQESALQLTAMMDVLPAGVAIYDAAGQMVRQNAVTARITRRPVTAREDAPARQSRYHMRRPDGTPMPETESPSGRARRGETFTDMACVIDGASGQATHLLTSGAPLLDEAGERIGAVVVLQDVTPLRQQERATSEQRALADGIFEFTPFGIALFDTSDAFCCERSNAPFLRLVGSAYQRDGTILGLPLAALFDADSGARVQALFTATRDSGVARYIDEFPAVLWPDPAPRWYRGSLSPLRGGSGAIESMLVCAVEITELVRARDEQRAEADRLRTVLDLLPAGVAIADAGGAITQVNPAFREIWGEPPTDDALEHAVDRFAARWADSGAPVARDEWALARALRDGATITDDEVIIQSPDGRERTIVNAAAPIRAADGVITGAVLAELDISERKRLERETVARATELEGIFDALTTAIIVFDARGMVTRINASGRALFAALVGEDYYALPLADRERRLPLYDSLGQPVPPDQWPTIRVLRGEWLASDRPRDYIYYDAAGHEISLSLTGVPLRDAADRVVGGVLVYQDITDRRQLTRRTQRSLDALLEMATAMVTATAPRATSRQIADLCRLVLGCSRVGVMEIERETERIIPTAVVGLDPADEARWWAMQAPDARFGDGADPALIHRIRAGEHVIMDMAAPPLDQQPNPFGITIILLVPMMQHGQLIGFITLDYSGARHQFTDDELSLARGVANLAAIVFDRDRLLAEREAARAEVLALESASERMDLFLGIASHELRTPLTSIHANLQLLDRGMRRAIAETPSLLTSRLSRVLEMTSRADQSIDRLNQLVQDLLDSVRIRGDNLTIAPAPHALDELTRISVAEARHLWPTRDITLTLPATPVNLTLDGGRVSQVITNYLTNALKYSAADAPVALRLSLTAEWARLEVTDHGPGLPLAERERVFDRFYRAPGVEVAHGSGVGIGLGLYICKTIIERHGGQVGVASVVGRGSTFWFTLPRATAGDLDNEVRAG